MQSGKLILNLMFYFPRLLCICSFCPHSHTSTMATTKMMETHQHQRQHCYRLWIVAPILVSDIFTFFSHFRHVTCHLHAQLTRHCDGTCILTAYIKTNLNSFVSLAGDNFFQYACGAWNKKVNTYFYRALAKCIFYRIFCASRTLYRKIRARSAHSK